MPVRMRLPWSKILYVLWLALVLAAAELLIRAAAKRNGNGEWQIGSVVLEPYQLPLNSTRKTIAKYESSSNSRILYDPDLGWTARPSSVSRDGLYRYNARGIRKDDETGERPAAGVLRVAIFGDSVAHSDDVPYEASWACLLERELSEAGAPAEVLNFAMSGYAMDQALLRYEKEGKPLFPDVVIFGLQPENVKRNLNLFRPLYTHGEGDIPFFKPRFVLEDGKLRLIGTPTLPPSQIISILERFEIFELSRYEGFYYPDQYMMRSWKKSRFLALTQAVLTTSNRYVFKHRERRFYSPDGESGRLALAIIKAFKESANQAGARFIAVHLPFAYYLRESASLGRFSYEQLLRTVSREVQLVRPEAKLLEGSKEAIETELYTPPSRYHFSMKGNQILAELLAKVILESVAPTAKLPAPLPGDINVPGGLQSKSLTPLGVSPSGVHLSNPNGVRVDASESCISAGRGKV